jgi:farnesyl diphosphate synthase
MATSKADFEAVFPKLVEDISAHAKQYNIPPEALEWFQKVPTLSLEAQIT